MTKHLFALSIVLQLASIAHAGGPAYVAGASYFDPSTVGSTLTWAQGTLSYYTDQGDLSAILPGASADTFVANTFATWTGIPTAALSSTHSGQLAEDVTGSTLAVANGVITTPADIAPSATATPIGLVYDQDGSVTDDLLGTGASNSADCAQNAVFGGIDNFGTNAHFLHALIILNGNCAQTSSQLPDLQYHLVRVIGRVLGLDWSQANLNVVTGKPSATAAQIAGFPLMHEFDPPFCVPVAICYSNNGSVSPSQPKMDDQAAISRLYPVSNQNLANFPEKKVFSQVTARIHGGVYFTDANGAAAQPMQGVNVVARWIDPSTGQPSGTAVASSISGYLFCGNAGNIITGLLDGTGQNFNRFGSNDPSLEGLFDLAGLQIPNGASSAQYQLAVEAIDPLWSTQAGPYGSASQVQPSGSAQPILVTVALDGDVTQNILMQSSAVQTSQWYGQTSFAAPPQLPASGNWAGVLSGYGDAVFFQFSAQANRTLSVIVNATDDSHSISEAKANPVVGMWALADPGNSPAPANTPSAFNTTIFGETRLDAQILQSSAFRVGIADYRGDGRPDYHYNARVLYGDSVSPGRASVAGGTPLTLSGLGLQANTSIKLGTRATSVLASSATQILVGSKAAPDGIYDVLLQDVSSGGSSTMTSALTVGAGPSDTIKMISGANPGTPIGGRAPAPFSVLVLSPDGVTPIAGGSVQFSSSPAVGLSACAGAASCTVLTDQSGVASTNMTVLSAGVLTLTAKLAPASYSNPQQVQTTLLGTESALDLVLITPPVWIAQEATVAVPVGARVLSNGIPVSGKTLNYQITAGSGALGAASGLTDANGNVSVNLQISSLNASVRVSVCVAPANSPCQILSATMVQRSSLQLLPVSGMIQIAASGQSFQPVAVRVLDSSSPPHVVLGANVAFLDYIGRMPGNQPILWTGESSISQPGMPVIIAESQATVQSDINGTASFPVATGGVSGNVAVIGTATAGSASLEYEAQELGP
ncbi:MAG: IPT/TIG domain-containing protein [Terriglobales bacterium]